jgi:peptidyl-prolyl cis-trans isomerase A (cyclophilin A)/peptidyl-prolyl cis-trans isomerase B (cyclophilin B)
MRKLLALLTVFAFLLALSACGESVPQSDDGEVKYAVISVRDFGEITIELHPEFAPLAVERFIENVRAGYYTGRKFHRIMDGFMLQGGQFDGTGTPPPKTDGIKTELHPDARHYYGAFCLAANAAGEGSDSFYIVNNKNTDTVERYRGIVESNLEFYQEYLFNTIADEDELVEKHGQERFDELVEDLWDLIEATMQALETIDDMPADVLAKYAEVGGSPELDGRYTVFGYAIDGFDVIDAISAVDVVDNGRGETSRPVQDVIINWIVVKSNIDK